MKNVKLMPMLLALAVPFCIMAQTLDPKAITKNPYQIRQSIIKGSGRYSPFQGCRPLLYPGKMQKSHFAFPAYHQNGSLDEPTRFPYQDPASSYFSTCPIALANGQVLLVWINPSGDTVYCAPSSDGGASWGNPIIVAATTSFNFNLSGVRTNTGRVIVIWVSAGAGIQTSFSDDNGANWSSPIPITSDGGDSEPTITQTVDGKLWLVYYRFGPTTAADIYFRTSTDNGVSWSAEQTFVATTAVELGGTIVSGNGAALYAVYSANVEPLSSDFNLYRRTSTDGGNTWSAPSPIINSSRTEFTPRVLRQSADTLWLTYERYEPSPNISLLNNSDIYYAKSTDGGNSWSAPVQFTRYVNYDGTHNATLFNRQPLVSFASLRWTSDPFQLQIWYGLIGRTMDTNPPPTLLSAFSFATQPNQAVLQAYVDDETGVSDVKTTYILNGVPHGPAQMYDDGQHHDGGAADNIWGTVIGPVQLGDLVFPAFSITDISSNTVEVNSFPLSIRAVHNVGNLILSFGEDSQLAESGAGTSAHWPANNGQDYLYNGGLWVGANAGGENRVMNRDYYEADLTRTAGAPYTLAPGVSDQDGSLTYDDTLTFFSLPIGLQVHQQSYQWSASTRDDFIVFKYTVRNLGVNSDLNEVFVSQWLDPDVTLQRGTDEAYDDQTGYDSQRRMLYIFDSQNDPPGYLGLKLLGAGKIPHTVHAYPIEEDAFDDATRFQYMSNGMITIPPGSGDRRLLLTAPPFSLATGDSATVAFGLVMGIDLAELQTHADTLNAIYEGLRTGVAESQSDPLPTNFSLAQNHPNPFNPSTKIRFSLPNAQTVSLKVFDLAGKEVATLIQNERKPAGRHEIMFDAGKLANGVYLYRLQAGDFSETKKMLLIK